MNKENRKNNKIVNLGQPVTAGHGWYGCRFGKSRREAGLGVKAVFSDVEK